MKNLSFFVSAFALFASSASAQTINCGTLPTCESLGYTDTVAQCPNKSIKCPFDTSKGTCLHEAAVGEVAYFAGPIGNATSKGWLPCDGGTYPRTKYPELAAFLDGHPMTNTSSSYGNPFCNNIYHASSCSADTFAVPDYRGYFLKVTGMWDGKKSNNTNFVGGTVLGLADAAKAPQKEQLPNITGGFSASYQTWKPTWSYGNNTWQTAPFECTRGTDPGGRINTSGYQIQNANVALGTSACNYKFDASKSSSVYTNSGHVIPANYSVYAYIYAGRVVK